MKTLSLFIFVALCSCHSMTLLAQTTTKTIYSTSISSTTSPTSPTTESVSTTSITNYLHHYVMHDEVTNYYLLSTGKVIDQNGQEVGYKTAPPKGREDEFKFMLKITNIGITYAIDQYGHVWQNKRPFKEIVGQEKK